MALCKIEGLSTQINCQDKGERLTDIQPKFMWTGIDWKKVEKHVNRLQTRTEAKPLRRVYVPKPGSAKKRPLSIPTMYDRAMQTLYALALSPVAESTADTCSFGFWRISQWIKQF